MNCPHCHNDVEVLEKNYGALFTCPKCGAVYFVNFDGVAEYSALSDVAEENFPSLSLSEPEILQQANDGFVDFAVAGDPLVTSFESPLLEQKITSHSQSPNSEFSDVAKEISDFGNSDTQISSLNYDVEIKGLDSREELLAFKESISDSRFGWDAADMMKRIRHGELYLEKLNPVQAFILGKRIHFLGLEVKWKQNVLE